MNEILLSHFMDNYFGISQFMTFNEITIHKKKTSHFTFQGKKIRPFTNHENNLYHLQRWVMIILNYH